jgi:GNAT superfamily N-acetyltransferase
MEHVPVRTYYLEMRAAPDYCREAPRADARLVPWKPASPGEYLKLYRAVGDAWGWTGRLLMPPARLTDVLNDPGNHLFKFIARGETLGFCELDATSPGQVEISYLGLLPAAVGQGFGRALLEDAVRQAWSFAPTRVWLHTCEFDHPRALGAYQRSGFVLYDEQVHHEAYPVQFLRDRQR